MVLAGKLHVVHMDGRARAAACGERYVDRFMGVGLHSPLFLCFWYSLLLETE
jgi:hypothetical protein